MINENLIKIFWRKKKFFWLVLRNSIIDTIGVLITFFVVVVFLL